LSEGEGSLPDWFINAPVPPLFIYYDAEKLSKSMEDNKASLWTNVRQYANPREGPDNADVALYLKTQLTSDSTAKVIYVRHYKPVKNGPSFPEEQVFVMLQLIAKCAVDIEARRILFMGSQFSTSEFTAKVNECMKGFNTV
jgi:hypothetical protein